MNDFQRLFVGDPSCAGEARRLVAAACQRLSLPDGILGRASIVVTEMATNLLKHAHGGELLIHSVRWAETPGIEILSLDKGPGIANLPESQQDGFSTTGSPGTGLGAIRRLSALFDIYSQRGRGTAVLSRVWSKPPPPSLPPRPLEVGAVCLPVRGEEACGDDWAVHQFSDRALLMAADGLGHGPYAQEAAGEAVRIFRQNSQRAPAEILERMHAALRGTRGAAVAMAEIVPGRRVLRYAGVGNLSARIISGETTRRLVSNNGTVGAEIRKVQEFTYPWPGDGLLVMHSDGLASSWQAEDYPGLWNKALSLAAGVLFRDHGRGKDDAIVLAAREVKGQP